MFNSLMAFVCRSQTAIFSWACIALLLACSQARAQVEQPAKPKTLKAKVTDRDNRPIEGAEVAWLDWFDANQDKPIDAVTDANGEFEIQERIGKESSYVVIKMPGYALSALNMGYLPARARLWPMKPVAFKIVDHQSQPISGAAVTASLVHFDDEYLSADLPAAITESTQVVTREDGWAILRCTRPEDLESVAVTSEKYGSQTFASNFTEKRFHVLQSWQSAPVTVQVLENGVPAVDWKLTAATDGNTLIGNKEPPIRTNPLNGNLLPMGLKFQGTTSVDGKFSVLNALMNRPVEFYLVDDKGELRRSHSVLANGSPNQTVIIKTKLPLKQSGKNRVGQLLDSQTDDPVGDVTVSIADYHTFPYRSATATSDDNGHFTVALAPGEWNWSIKDKPQGQHVVSESGGTFIVREDDKRLPKLSLRVRDSKMIKGTIRGVDLAIRRARWIHVHWEIDGELSVDHGTFNSDGTFAVEIPADATLDHCEIVAVGGGNDTLVVKSKDPLVLTSTVIDEDVEK